MATINFQSKKNFSEANMRRIISILTGLMSSVSSLEDQCIKEYDDTVTYQKGQIVIGSDGYFYEAKTVATGTWDASKWTKIGTDNITELDVDTIKSYLNLTQEQITNLQSLIDDTTITTTKTNSSSKIYMDIQAAIAECKDDTLKQIAKKVSGSYKIATSTAEVTSADYIYLINNGANYDLYVLVDSTPTKVGDTSIDLTDYAKTSDLSDYLKSSDADGKFATITTVDGKVDKTDILTSKSNTATDEQVYSAKAINTELDGVVKKTDISTTIDGTSTNVTVPTNKSVWDSLYKICDSQVLVDANSPTSKICMADLTTLNTPAKEGMTSAESSLIISIEGRDYWNGQISITMAEPEVYVRSVREVGTWTKWRKLCSSSVADVPVTNITSNLVSTKVALDNSDSYATYYVKSGTCYVTIWSLRLIEACSVETIFNGLPKSTIGVTCPLCNGVESFAQVFMSPNSGVIAFNANASLVNKSGYCSFSYPVAES